MTHTKSPDRVLTWEWADNQFAVHRAGVVGADIHCWRVSHIGTGACISDDLDKDVAIRKWQRMLLHQGEKRFKESVAQFFEICKASVIGDTSRMKEMIANKVRV